eukprot:767059-Hanusia_phi.AAC.2
MQEAAREVVAIGYAGGLQRLDEASENELVNILSDLREILPGLVREWSRRAHPDRGGDIEVFRRGLQAREALPKLTEERIQQLRDQRAVPTP